MQLDFLDQLDPPAARRCDPATSKRAAQAALHLQLKHAARILAALRRYGPMTVDEIARFTKLASQQINKRLPELERAGHAKPTGHERPSNSGRDERVWEAVE